MLYIAITNDNNNHHERMTKSNLQCCYFCIFLVANYFNPFILTLE